MGCVLNTWWGFVCAVNCLFYAILLGMEAVGKKVPRDIRKLIGQGDFIERGQGLRRLLKRRLYETSNALKKEGQAVPAQVQQMVESLSRDRETQANNFVVEDVCKLLARLMGLRIAVVSQNLIMSN